MPICSAISSADMDVTVGRAPQSYNSTLILIEGLDFDNRKLQLLSGLGLSFWIHAFCTGQRLSIKALWHDCLWILIDYAWTTMDIPGYIHVFYCQLVVHKGSAIWFCAGWVGCNIYARASVEPHRTDIYSYDVLASLKLELKNNQREKVGIWLEISRPKRQTINTEQIQCQWANVMAN